MTATQPDLFTAAQEAKREAVDRVEAHTDPTWWDAAIAAVRAVAARVGYFTTDAVWAELEACYPDQATHEPRAMGAVMRQAARAGLVERTDRVRPSERAANHARPVAIWRSLHEDSRG